MDIAKYTKRAFDIGVTDKYVVTEGQRWVLDLVNVKLTVFVVTFGSEHR